MKMRAHKQTKAREVTPSCNLCFHFTSLDLQDATQNLYYSVNKRGTGAEATVGNTQPPPRSPALLGGRGGEPTASLFYRKKWKFRDGRYFLNVTRHTGVQRNTCSSDKRERNPNFHCRAPLGAHPAFPHLVSLHRFAWGSRPLSKPDFPVTGQASPGQGCGLCASGFPRVKR